MCYHKAMHLRNNLQLNLLDVEREIDKDWFDEATLHDGFMYARVPVVVPNQDCTWDLQMMEWGFIPYYITTREAVDRFRKGGYNEQGKYCPPVTTLNAIGEELLLPNKMYREAALKRRCLFVSTGFFEWRHVFPIGKKGQPLKTAIKYPYHIRTKGAGDVHLTAGIWQRWTDKETGETVNTCALVTTVANDLMKQIHNTKNRMPAILTPELAGEWISDGLTEERINEIATFQYPSHLMEAWPIQKDFKTASDPLEEFVYGTELPPLNNENVPALFI